MNSNISPIIQSQIPSFLAGGDLSDFLISYYKWLESSNSISIGDISELTIGFLENESEYTLPSENRQAYSALSSIKDYQDFQKTPANLISKFVGEYMEGIPIQKLSSIRSSMGLMKRFYENKGNENSIEYLFNLLYKETVKILYPSDRILSISSARWKEGTYVRILQSDITTTELDTLVGTYVVGSDSGARGYLDSYTHHSLKSNFANLSDRDYYKLLLLEVDPQNTFTSNDMISGKSLMSGFGGITFSVNNINLYPISKIVLDHDGPMDDQAAQSFGAAVKIESFVKDTLTSDKISSIDAGTYVPVLVNDFFDIYEYDSNQAVAGQKLQGQKSGAIGIIVGEADGSKLWVKDINGTFLTDYQVDEIGGSELVDVVDNSGNVLTSFRMKRKYSASKIPAQVRVSNGTAIIDYEGKDYVFNPRVQSDTISITGFGVIEELNIVEMGFSYTDSAHVDIKVGNNTLGTVLAGVVSTDKFFESKLNTLDGEAKLRDSNYYQEFSYELKTQVPMIQWEPIVTKLTHPAGMKVFGREETVSSPFDLSLTAQPDTTVLFELIEPHNITNIVHDSGNQTNFNLTDEAYLNGVLGGIVHNISYTTNWVDYSSATDYGTEISRVYFNEYDTSIEYNNLNGNSITNECNNTFDQSHEDALCDSSMSVSSQLISGSTLFDSVESSEMDLHDRDYNQEAGINTLVFDYGINSEVLVDWKDPDITGAPRDFGHEIGFDSEWEADGSGDESKDDGFKVFETEIETSFEEGGSGGNLTAHPKPKVHDGYYSSYYYMGDS